MLLTVFVRLAVAMLISSVWILQAVSHQLKWLLVIQTFVNKLSITAFNRIE